MNSDEIERLQRARRRQPPGVRRSTLTPLTPLTRPTFVLPHRRKDETLRTNRTSFWPLYDVLFKRFWVARKTNGSFFFHFEQDSAPACAVRRRPWMLTLCADYGRIR